MGLKGKKEKGTGYLLRERVFDVKEKKDCVTYSYLREEVRGAKEVPGGKKMPAPVNAGREGIITKEASAISPQHKKSGRK